jgi:hypothetical protein
MAMECGAVGRWERVGIAGGEARLVPLLGMVAAGVPLLAFAVEDTLAVPPGLWSGKNVFALRVRGTSMSDEGIRDGDYLIVEPRDTAQSGQTVVAEVDGGVTVKRLFREADGRIRLQPASPEMLPLVIGAERVRVIGAVVGVLRRQGFHPTPRRPVRPAPAPADDVATLDLSLEAMARLLREAEGRGAERGRIDAARLRDLARSLRALRDCYLETTTPRLRRALLQEAAALMPRLSRLLARTRSASNRC